MTIQLCHTDDQPSRAWGTAIRLTESQHRQLMSCLFPGDGLEAIAFALCGRAGSLPEVAKFGDQRDILIVHQILAVDVDRCTRSVKHVSWPTDVLSSLLERVSTRRMAILKIHSHPTHCREFSPTDDQSDIELFAAVANYDESGLPHGSAIMFPDGRISARLVTARGELRPVDCVSVVGNRWTMNYAADNERGLKINEADKGSTRLQHRSSTFNQRTRQAFGDGTVSTLSRLSIAVVGASGTGSPVIEMLARLGVGRLVIVDPDTIEDRNRDRILHSTADDARHRRSKSQMLADAVRRMGLGTEVQPIKASLWDNGAAAWIAQCDALIGCMDSVDGRDLLNRLATYYCIPYFDIGVHLDADGLGGVSQISGSVHYLIPGGSSLRSRGVFSADDVRAAILRRTEPKEYWIQREAKYIHGANEDRPAVISVNMLLASLAINELLARVHGFRDDSPEKYARTQISLTQWRMTTMEEETACPILASKVGRGDAKPLLDTPALDIDP